MTPHLYWEGPHNFDLVKLTQAEGNEGTQQQEGEGESILLDSGYQLEVEQGSCQWDRGFFK